jgi:hypothetical protein
LDLVLLAGIADFGNLAAVQGNEVHSAGMMRMAHDCEIRSVGLEKSRADKIPDRQDQEFVMEG